MHDVLIIGAGPAGSIAAAELAAAGFDIAMIDRCQLPRYKTCGGGLVRRALQALPLEELDLTIEAHCLRAELHVARRAGGRMSFAVERSEPLVSLVMRTEFDHALNNLAIRRGARLLEACDLLALDVSADGVRARTSQGEIAARMAIGADGATGRTARMAGFGVPRPGIPALEWELRVPPEVHARFARAVRFDIGVLPSGYAWVFPKGAHLSVGILSTRRGTHGLDEALQHYLDDIGCGPSLSAERHGFVIPLEPHPGGVARGRVLLAGDAAGLADPLTAEGLTHAILSGQMAARALIASRLDPSRARREYTAQLERTVLRELRWARRLARILYRDPLPEGLFERIGPTLCRTLARVISGETGYADLFWNPANFGRLVRALVGSQAGQS